MSARVGAGEPLPSVCIDEEAESTEMSAAARTQVEPFKLRQLRIVIRIGLLVSMVRAANEGAGFDMHEPALEREVLELDKFARVVIARHWCVTQGRTEILSDGQNGDACMAKIVKHRDDFAVLLTESHHDPGLGRYPRTVPPST